MPPNANTATFTFPGLPNGRLADGAWRATLASADVADPIGRHLTNTAGGGSAGDGWRFGFVRLTADTNRDGRVDVRDLGAFAQNYGRSTAAGPSGGDFNYDGRVDVLDLGALAQQYGKSYTPPA